MRRRQGLVIELRGRERREDLVAQQRQFDCVIALEVIEHVPDAGDFLRSCAALIKPGALLVLSTLNRTVKSYALGIVAAEYLLGWLPKGTHQWRRFIAPAELREMLSAAGLNRSRNAGSATTRSRTNGASAAIVT